MKANRAVIGFTYNGHDVRIAAKLRKAGPNLLILLHGIGCSKESFDGVFSAESLRRYSICAFDFPGHGESSKRLPNEFFTLQSYADIADLVIEQLLKRSSLGLEDRPDRPHRVFIAGHSMGGAVGVLLAEGRQDVECLVSIDGNLVGEELRNSEPGHSWAELRELFRRRIRPVYSESASF